MGQLFANASAKNWFLTNDRSFCIFNRRSYPRTGHIGRSVPLSVFVWPSLYWSASGRGGAGVKPTPLQNRRIKTRPSTSALRALPPLVRRKSYQRGASGCYRISVFVVFIRKDAVRHCHRYWDFSIRSTVPPHALTYLGVTPSSQWETRNSYQEEPKAYAIFFPRIVPVEMERTLDSHKMKSTKLSPNPGTCARSKGIAAFLS